MRTFSICLSVVLISSLCIASVHPDFDNSGTVDILDLQEFSDSWLDSGSIPENLDSVGNVDLADFSIFSSWWLKDIPPTASPDAYTVLTNSSILVPAPGVLGNDYGAGTLSTVLDTDVSSGTLTLNSDGSFYYVPNPGYTGTDSFSYKASGSTGLSEAVTVSLSISAASGSQMLINGGFEDPVGSGPISTSGDWVELGTNQKIQAAGWASEEGLNGAWLQGWSNNINSGFYQDVAVTAGTSYTFDSGFRIETNFAVSGNIDMELIWLDIGGSEISRVTFDIDSVVANDGQWSHQGIVAEAPAGATTARCQIHWTTGTQGTVNPRSAMVDNMAFFANATAPQATDDNYSTPLGVPLNQPAPGVLLNDSDPQSDPLTAVLVTEVSNGSLVLNTNGSFTYTPDPGFNSTDSFTYQAHDGTEASNTATVQIAVGGDPVPVAVEEAYYTYAGIPINEIVPGVLGNDSDPLSVPLTAVLVSNVSNGALSLNANGSFSYTPDAGFDGTDSFTYKADNGTYQSSAVTVTINIGSNMLLNSDFEIGTPGGWMDTNWNCANWTRELLGGSDINIWLTDNSYYSYLGAGNQAIATRWSNWRVYQEFTASAGQDYTMSVEVYNDRGPTNYWDGHLYIEWLDASDDLIGVNTSIAKYNSPTDPQDQWVLIYGSAVAPAGTAKGRVSYQAESGAGSNKSLLFFDNAGAFNSYDLPTANDDAFDINVNGSLSITANGILNNDSSPNTSSPTAIQLSDAGHGTAVLNSDGSFTYTPTAGYDGFDSFTYRMYDGVTYSAPATVTINMIQADATSTTSAWTSAAGSPVTSGAVSRLTGFYATASTNGDTVEIRDIREDLLHTITAAQIQAAAPTLDMAGSLYGPCGLAFTPSGRQLFIAVASASGQDVIIGYKLNQKTLRSLTTLTIDDIITDTQPYGMAHYSGQLFMGTDNGSVRRYKVEMNDATASLVETFTVPGSGGIRGIDVDEYQEVLYVSTKENICRVDVSNKTGAAPEVIYSSTDIGAIGFGRAYGGSGQEGLYFIEGNTLKFISTAAMQSSNKVSAAGYMTLSDVTSLSATACGRLFAIVNGSPMMISDTSDTRMDFEAWLQDEFNQYVNYGKNCVSPGSLPEGWVVSQMNTGNVSSHTQQPGGGTNNYYLLFGDLINNDAECEELIRLMQVRGAGIHPDGISVDSSIDGWLVRNFDPYTGVIDAGENFMPFGTDTAMNSSTMAKNFYPNNADIQQASTIFLNALRRQADFIHVNVTPNSNQMKLYWNALNLGPIDTPKDGINELQTTLEYAAAQDPLCSWIYDYSVYNRDRNYRNEYVLTDERISESNWPAFIPLWNYSYQRHLRTDPVWRQEFYNYLSLFSAWTDDNGAKYLTVFSAGDNHATGSNFNSDSFDENDHPWEITHFPAVVGFSMFGDTSPSVGAYFAYREGRRTAFATEAGIPQVTVLTRWANGNMEWENPKVSQPDMFFGIFGLAEILSPGSVNTIIGKDAYIPVPEESTSPGGNVRLDYSDITPRRVLASNDGVNWTSYGFQMTPFIFDSGVSYTYYEALDPEGQPLNLGLENMAFEEGLNYWAQFGTGYTFTTTSNVSEHIVGTSAEIQVKPSSSSATAGLTETFSVADDFAETLYIVRGNGRLLTAGAPGHGYLRVQWDSDNNPGNGIISEQISNYVDDTDNRVEFRIDALRVSGADYMHLSFVVEKVTSTNQRFIFDDLSVVRVGTEIPSASNNGGFETGTLAGWGVGGVSGNAKITSGGDVLEGAYSLWFDFPSSQYNNSTSIQQNYDITGDPEGTRYMIRVKLDPVALNASEPVLTLTTGSRTLHTLTLKSDMDYIVDFGFSFRKKAGETTLTTKFEVTRTDSGVSTTDKIIFDSFEIHKEWPQYDN